MVAASLGYLGGCSDSDGSVNTLDTQVVEGGQSSSGSADSEVSADSSAVGHDGTRPPSKGVSEVSGDCFFNSKPAPSSLSLSEITTVEVNQAPIWLFPVVDDGGQIYLSAEGGGGIKIAKVSMAELEGANKKISPTWKTVISPEQIGGESVADHWHIFAHDRHWIVFSTQKATVGRLLVLSKDLDQLALITLVNEMALIEDEVPFVGPGGSFLPTNDMFLVEGSSSVHIGFFLPGTGHRLFGVDLSYTPSPNVDIGGKSYTPGNDASALRTANGYLALVPDTINALAYSALHAIQFDNDWTPVCRVELVGMAKTSLSMPSAVFLDIGELVIHSRLRPDAHAKGERPPPPKSGSPLQTIDNTQVWRFVIGANGVVKQQQAIDGIGPAFRPHTTVVGNRLLTAWDRVGHTYLRVDSILSEEK